MVLSTFGDGGVMTEPTPAPERYRLKGQFGSRAAINSTSACRDCGAVVDDTDVHDRWHDAIDASTHG